jgi:hypothetical protein
MDVLVKQAGRRPRREDPRLMAIDGQQIFLGISNITRFHIEGRVETTHPPTPTTDRVGDLHLLLELLDFMLEAHLLFGEFAYFLDIIFEQEVDIAAGLTELLELLPAGEVVVPHRLKLLCDSLVNCQYLLDKVF